MATAREEAHAASLDPHHGPWRSRVFRNLAAECRVVRTPGRPTLAELPDEPHRAGVGVRTGQQKEERRGSRSRGHFVRRSFACA
eukprot:309159-Prymnesium_polylepis.1